MRLLMLAVLVVVAVSCREDPIVPCPLIRDERVMPADTTITIGGQYAMRVTLLYQCGGTQVLTDTFTWTSLDPSVAAIDSVTGVVRGLRAGSATILPTGKTYGPLRTARVTVQ